MALVLSTAFVYDYIRMPFIDIDIPSTGLVSFKVLDQYTCNRGWHFLKPLAKICPFFEFWV